MRIAAITNSRIPSLTANSIQALKASQAMMQIGHEVKIFAPREAAAISTSALAKHYGIQTVPEIQYLFSHKLARRVDFIVQAQFGAQKFKADLIYTWLPQSALLGLLQRYPVILEMHAEVGGMLGRWWLRQFWRLAGQKRMTVTTRALRTKLESSLNFRLSDEEIILAPNGVDLERYRELPEPTEARRRINLRQQETAGFTGHIYPGRGADLLFDLAQRMPEVQFLWVGGNPDMVEFWRGKLRAVSLNNVILTGFVENSLLPLYQAAADVLLMSYSRSIHASSGQEISEVINPMKMFEYMAASRAIISADLPVIREALNDRNAVFCAPEDIDAWQSAIRGLLNDKEKRLKLGVQAALDVQDHTWKARAIKILKGLSFAA